MHWWDKKDNEVIAILTGSVGKYSDKEIEDIYENDFCLRDKDNKELSLEEAKDWYKKL